MPLPTDRDLTWPPPHIADYTRQQHESAAWWAGDIDHLRNNGPGRRFWKHHASADVETPAGLQGRAMHASLAASIVSTSADLLFGEVVGLTIPPPEETGETGETTDTATVDGIVDGDASVSQEAAAVDLTQARLDELREQANLDSRWLEAGEVAAGLGGAWLRPVWDATFADHPLLTVVDPLYAVPEYRFGQLVAVTFWEVVDDDKTTVWRHLERHEVDIARDPATREPILDEQGNKVPRGVILHGLYKGDKDKLGTARELTEKPATATLAPRVEVPEAAGPLMPACVDNVLPNRKSRRLPIGRSDFQGAEDELDALDEAWSSLLRDIRLGKVRMIVPERTLERAGNGPGSGRTFDVDKELMVETDAAPDEKGAALALMQGAIRATEHLETIRALTEAVVFAAGYSPATFGVGIEGAAESGTARAIRERRTFRTIEKKRRNAARAVAHVCRALLAIDVAVFGRAGVVPMLPRVEWPDITADPRTTAERIQLLRAAQAISIRNAVREAQPALTPEEVDAEVSALMAELGVADPDAILRDQATDDLDDEPVEPVTVPTEEPAA